MSRLDVRMPALGQSVAEGTVVRWLKREGERVAAEEALVEIQTDKAESEVPAERSGVLAEVLVPEGETVEVGTILGRMDVDSPERGESDAAESDTADRAGAGATDRGAHVAGGGGAGATARAGAGATDRAPADGLRDAECAETERTAAGRAPAGTAPRIERAAAASPTAGSFLSPAVRKLSREHGLSAEEVRRLPGSGRYGRVTHRDLVRWLEEERRAGGEDGPGARGGEAGARAGGAVAGAGGAAPGVGGAASGEDVEIVPLTGLRKRIAEHLLSSWRGAPHVHTVAEVDLSAVVAARRAHAEELRRHGASLSYTAFFLHATARALSEHPSVNALLDERGLVTHRRVHLGLAVALEPSGLVVPVLRDAHRMSVRELALEAHRLAERARRRALTADEMAGGTCTLTNPGLFGNLFGTPILHQPQVAIVDFGAVRKSVVVTDDDAIAIRPTCHVVLGWDHRAMDGATAARFLQRVVGLLEDMPTDGIDHRP